MTGKTGLASIAADVHTGGFLFFVPSFLNRRISPVRQNQELSGSADNLRTEGLSDDNHVLYVRMIKLLLVQPDTAAERELRKSLATHDIECIHASNQKQAMRTLESDYLIDAVMVAAGKGNCCARELLQSIRENARFQFVPILMACYGCAADNVVEALRRGASDVISMPTPSEQVAQRIAAAVEKGKRRILVVDDEPVIREYLTDMLQMERFSPLSAASGSEALAFLENTPVQAVISDIMMPGMSGMELLVEVKQKYENLPVILITGYGGKYTAQEILAAGADGYFQKPFKNVELVRTLRTILKVTAKNRKPVSQQAVSQRTFQNSLT